MTYRLSDALRRADLSLAGALFLGLTTAAAVTAYTPARTANSTVVPKFRPAILQSSSVSAASDVAVSPSMAPEVVPAPRPVGAVLSRMKIGVALEAFAAETGCLAEALYYEARGQGLPGQKAIAEVVVRRTQRGGYPHSICGVVHQGRGSSCQFSFVCDGTMDHPKAAGEWNHAVRLATQIITGALPLTNITQGAISFHAARIAADWPGMVRTAIIGNNVFYRRSGRDPVPARVSAPPLKIEADVQAGSGVGDGANGNIVNASLGDGASTSGVNVAGSLENNAAPTHADSAPQVIDTHVIEQDSVHTQ
jgi:cell wall hydrolase